MEDTKREELEEEYEMPPGRLMYHLYVEEGMSSYDIAEELEEKRETVRYWLQQSGVKMRSRTLSDVQRILILAYIDAGLGGDAIASRLGCGRATVNRYRKELEQTGEPVDLDGWITAEEYNLLCGIVENWIDDSPAGEKVN